MSIIHKICSYSLLDHRDYITKVYENVPIDDQEPSAFTLLAKLFSILNVKSAPSRKRTHDSDNWTEEALMVKEVYEKMIQELPLKIKDDLITKYKLIATSEVRDLSKQLFESTIFHMDGVKGGNNSEISLKCSIKGHEFLVPCHSRFLCGCVKEQCQKLDGTKYDIIIADPPWWNKYIRRLKSANDKLSYSMMYNDDIASIPVKDLLAENCLVAVWCTNSPTNVAAVKDLIFPKWGVEYIATWYWLKITVDFLPMCAFGSGSKKQPYERLILGKLGDVNAVPDGHVVVSVPSALHSHKPPLLNVLEPFMKTDKPQALELFARYLLPNTTSVGYEPLKWQHESLYENVT